MTSAASTDTGFLDAVPGQELAKRFFRNALRQERLSHAYLFAGPEGSGKRVFVRELAKAFLCPQSGAACSCASCRAVDHDNHPGVTFYGIAEGKSVVDIETVRFLCERTQYRRDHLQLTILEDADRMSEPAANALLKTLEEPPDGVLLILLARSTAVLPTTIVSRCHRIPFLKADIDLPELSGEKRSHLAEILEPSFFVDREPRAWLDDVLGKRPSLRAAVMDLLDVLLTWGRLSLGDQQGTDLDTALRTAEAFLELRTDVERGVQADLVLERVIRLLRTRPAGNPVRWAVNSAR